MSVSVVAHIHTRHSFDCMTDVKDIVLKATEQNVNVLIITDHDSFQGSIEARRIAEERKLSIEVPVAAEILTDVGDMIVILPVPVAIERDHKKLCAMVRERGGWTILPHPYVGHNLEALDASNVDYIEVFNSRCSNWENEQAHILCRSLKKRPFCGSDAHLLSDLFNAFFAVDQWPDAQQVIPICFKATSKMRIHVSQIIKGVKLRRPLDVARGVAKCVLRSAGTCDVSAIVEKYR